MSDKCNNSYHKMVATELSNTQLERTKLKQRIVDLEELLREAKPWQWATASWGNIEPAHKAALAWEDKRDKLLSN